jgi:hypothetical protein
MPTDHPGFNRVNRPLAFDRKGNLFVALEASGNICADPSAQGRAPSWTEALSGLRSASWCMAL